VSRLRTIKPGFFTNEELSECDPLARLLFAGLWTEADRDGRLEDRPRRLKALILPYDKCDADTLLGQLERRGFILRYEVAGEKYISIPRWYEHQKPHFKESSRGYPEPPKIQHLQVSRVKSVASNDLVSDEQRGLLSSVLGKEIKEGTSPTEIDQTEEVFATQFWTLWPKRHGSRKTTLERFRRLPSRDRSRVLAALGHFVSAVDDGRYGVEYLMRAENFVGGQKCYYEEWADGPPEKYTNGNGKRKTYDAVSGKLVDVKEYQHG
jgi:hypothetical protein